LQGASGKGIKNPAQMNLAQGYDVVYSPDVIDPLTPDRSAVLVILWP
jgi:hypothetical protein